MVEVTGSSPVLPTKPKAKSPALPRGFLCLTLYLESGNLDGTEGMTSFDVQKHSEPDPEFTCRSLPCCLS